jgi:N-acetylglucosamine kinase-like BadF-type ATPase
MGFDVGGSGARGALAELTTGELVPVARVSRDTPSRTGPRGIDGVATAELVTGLAADLLAEAAADARVVAVAVGCAGASTMGHDLRAHLPAAFASSMDAALVIICSDMVTSFLGALAGKAGVVLAVGTGAVAVGSDLVSRWQRVDGWGQVIGDLGGGAWIGRAGLTAALRSYDGRRHGSSLLLAEVKRRFTDPPTLVAELHRRDDRAAVLASVAPAVLAAARCGDPVAVQIQAEACRHLADAAAAARPGRADDGRDHTPLAITGSLLDAHDGFRAGLLAELPADLEVLPAAGTACDGALRLGRAIIEDRLPTVVKEQTTLHFPTG